MLLPNQSPPLVVQCYVGLGEEHSCVHIMFVFRDPNKDAAYDDSVALSFKLPIET